MKCDPALGFSAGSTAHLLTGSNKFSTQDFLSELFALQLEYKIIVPRPRLTVKDLSDIGANR